MNTRPLNTQVNPSIEQGYALDANTRTPYRPPHVEVLVTPATAGKAVTGPEVTDSVAPS
jgi:hypothetical protein